MEGVLPESAASEAERWAAREQRKQRHGQRRRSRRSGKVKPVFPRIGSGGQSGGASNRRGRPTLHGADAANASARDGSGQPAGVGRGRSGDSRRAAHARRWALASKHFPVQKKARSKMAFDVISTASLLKGILDTVIETFSKFQTAPKRRVAKELLAVSQTLEDVEGYITEIIRSLDEFAREKQIGMRVHHIPLVSGKLNRSSDECWRVEP